MQNVIKAALFALVIALAAPAAAVRPGDVDPPYARHADQILKPAESKAEERMGRLTAADLGDRCESAHELVYDMSGLSQNLNEEEGLILNRLSSIISNNCDRYNDAEKSGVVDTAEKMEASYANIRAAEKGLLNLLTAFRCRTGSAIC